MQAASDDNRVGVGYRKKSLRLNGALVRESRVIVERILGRPLPPDAVVHHANEDSMDNRPENLVVCPDRAYHNLLHARMRALDACGHADWRKCSYCKVWKAPGEMYLYPGNAARCRQCVKAQLYARRRAKGMKPRVPREMEKRAPRSSVAVTTLAESLAMHQLLG